MSATASIVTGVDLLGQPLRLVQLLKIVGLSMAAGVAWTHAIMRAQYGKTADSYREP